MTGVLNFDGGKLRFLIYELSQSFRLKSPYLILDVNLEIILSMQNLILDI